MGEGFQTQGLEKLCDVLNGKKRGYIHREWGPKRGQGQRDLETIQKNLR